MLLLYVILGLVIVGLIVYLIIKKKKESEYYSGPNTTSASLNNGDISDTSNIADDAETVSEYIIEKSDDEFLPYKRKNLMTKNEWFFYKQLKPVADKLGFSILCKVRVADLVDIDKGLDKSKWQTAFNRINKKHVDFVLCKPENLYPELLIELDDLSHKSENVIKRDEFIQKLYDKTGYKLLRVQGGGNIEDKIREALELNNNGTSV